MHKHDYVIIINSPSDDNRKTVSLYAHTYIVSSRFPSSSSSSSLASFSLAGVYMLCSQMKHIIKHLLSTCHNNNIKLLFGTLLQKSEEQNYKQNAAKKKCFK
jgi:hypothetical protein